MSFLVPAFFVAAVGVAIGVIALHFIVTRHPPMELFPTTRFIPEVARRAPSRAIRPEDLWLMLMRVLLILVIGAAFARPIAGPQKRAAIRILILDVSRSVQNVGAVRDSARALYRPGDAVILMDSSARRWERPVADSFATLRRSEYGGHLSPALVLALRTLSKVRSHADSFELAIVSPLTQGELDEATSSLRALWPGRIRISRVAARRDSARASVVEVRGNASDDPLGDAVLLLDRPQGLPGMAAQVRLLRTAPRPADSAWARQGGHTLVYWPAAKLPEPWSPRTPVDTIGAVSARAAVVVAPFERRGRLPVPQNSTVVARWADGEPAGIEQALGAGCIRSIAVTVPVQGDLILRPSFTRLLARLTEPCGGREMNTPVSPDEVTVLAGTGPLAPASRVRAAERPPTPVVPWLLGLAAVLALVELLVRGAGDRTVPSEEAQ